MLGQELTMTVESIKTNVQIEESRFQPPDDIKALIAKP
jgi:hypothetical protein